MGNNDEASKASRVSKASKIKGAPEYVELQAAAIALTRKAEKFADATDGDTGALVLLSMCSSITGLILDPRSWHEIAKLLPILTDISLRCIRRHKLESTAEDTNDTGTNVIN